MNFTEAQAYAQTIQAKRFWMTMRGGRDIHLYECRAFKRFGEWGHEKRFVGWKDFGKKAVRCDRKNKKWKRFWLAMELTRTDWKVEIISNEVKLLLTQRENYSKLYGK